MTKTISPIEVENFCLPYDCGYWVQPSLFITRMVKKDPEKNSNYLFNNKSILYAYSIISLKFVVCILKVHKEVKLNQQ